MLHFPSRPVPVGHRGETRPEAGNPIGKGIGSHTTIEKKTHGSKASFKVVPNSVGVWSVGLKPVGQKTRRQKFLKWGFSELIKPNLA